MPVSNEKNEKHSYKKQKRWSLISILTKKKKFKKSQESVDFYPYDGKFNQKVAQNNHLERSTECLIEQYTRSPRQIRRCNSLQHTSQVSDYSNIINQHSLNEWNSSQQSVYSTSSSACYSDIELYRSCGNSNRLLSDTNERSKQTLSTLNEVPFRCSSEIGHYQTKKNYNQRYSKTSSLSNKLIGKKIPPPPPPRDPNIKAVYYFRNNRLMSRESDSTYFSQGSDDDISNIDKTHEDEIEYQNKYYIKEPARSRKPIQICDVETLSIESENTVPKKIQSVEEAIRELEDIYNSLGLSDEDLLDRAERRDLPTLHQNMRYQSSDDLDCVTISRVLPKTRRSGTPDIIFDDMAFRRLNKKESKPQNFVPSSFLLVMPTVYNLDKRPKSHKEPDITLDDVVFRSRRQRLNFLKISEPQPPFGIPLGPIIGAASSDYLHAIPEGRYKPSFHPRKIPDTVEDDLAFRTLRKDNKYKTCIDFSFIRRNRLQICDPIPKPSRGRIKDDTHWIIKKTPVDRMNFKNQAKLAFNDLTDSDICQNLMLVKIDHHKPIMLTGFTVNEANQLSKSLFKTNVILQHDTRKPMLTDGTRYCTSNYAPQPQITSNNSLCALNGPRTLSAVLPDRLQSLNVNNGDHVAGIDHITEKNSFANCLSRVLPMTITSRRKSIEHLDSRNQPNFRELIKREYSLDCRYHDLSPDDQLSSKFVRATEDRRQQLLRGLRTRACQVDDDGTIGFRSTIHDGDYGLTRPEMVTASASQKNSTESQTEISSSSSVSTDDQHLNRSLSGYMEVCSYITVYIYHLFSVNAYSTFVALIFLVALHVCRRMS